MHVFMFSLLSVFFVYETVTADSSVYSLNKVDHHHQHMKDTKSLECTCNNTPSYQGDDQWYQMSFEISYEELQQNFNLVRLPYTSSWKISSLTIDHEPLKFRSIYDSQESYSEQTYYNTSEVILDLSSTNFMDLNSTAVTELTHIKNPQPVKKIVDLISNSQAYSSDEHVNSSITFYDATHLFVKADYNTALAKLYSYVPPKKVVEVKFTPNVTREGSLNFIGDVVSDPQDKNSSNVVVANYYNGGAAIEKGSPRLYVAVDQSLPVNRCKFNLSTDYLNCLSEYYRDVEDKLLFVNFFDLNEVDINTFEENCLDLIPELKNNSRYKHLFTQNGALKDKAIVILNIDINKFQDEISSDADFPFMYVYGATEGYNDLYLNSDELNDIFGANAEGGPFNRNTLPLKFVQPIETQAIDAPPVGANEK